MITYRCWIPEYGQRQEDGRDVEAYEAEMAVCIFMRDYERRSAEYPVAGGGSLDVAVQVGDAPPGVYTVYGEAVPHYHARRAKGAPNA